MCSYARLRIHTLVTGEHHALVHPAYLKPLITAQLGMSNNKNFISPYIMRVIIKIIDIVMITFNSTGYIIGTKL